MRFRKRAKYIIQDIGNIARFGLSAPLFAERIWVQPNKCNQVLTRITDPSGREWEGRCDSARVVNYAWPTQNAVSLYNLPKFNFCIEHWVHGKSWEDTGVYEYINKLIAKKGRAVDGCRDTGDIINRYTNLDLIFEQIKSDGRFKTMEETAEFRFREFGGPGVHIGPSGALFFTGAGTHRFAMAHILSLPLPAQIGLVHISAISHLNTLRKNEYSHG